MASKNSDVILNTHATHRTTSFIRTRGGDDITSLFPRHQTSSHDTIDTHSVISTQAVPNMMFQNGGGYIDFTLPRLMKKIDEITLEVMIKNPSAILSRLMLAAVQCVTHVEYFSGTSFLMSTDFLAMRMKHLMTQTSDRVLATSPFTNIRIDSKDGAYATYDNGIETGEEKTFFIPVTGCFHSLIPGFLNEDLRIRVHFADEANFSGADFGLYLTGSRLLVEATNLLPAELSEVEAVYRSNTLSVRYYEPRVQRIPIVIGGSGTYQVNLQNFFGNFVSLWVLIQNQAIALTTGVLTLDEVDRLWMSDASGQTMFGGLVHTSEWLRYSNARFYPSAFLASTFMYAFNASQHPQQDLLTGSHGGSFALHAKGESLNFITKSTVSSNSARHVVVIGWHASCLRIQNGNIVALR